MSNREMVANLVKAMEDRWRCAETMSQQEPLIWIANAIFLLADQIAVFNDRIDSDREHAEWLADRKADRKAF